MAKIKQKDIDFILKTGEGLRVEFKESPNRIDKTIVAFANAEGGKIYNCAILCHAVPKRRAHWRLGLQGKGLE